MPGAVLPSVPGAFFESNISFKQNIHHLMQVDYEKKKLLFSINRHPGATLRCRRRHSVGAAITRYSLAPDNFTEFSTGRHGHASK